MAIAESKASATSNREKRRTRGKPESTRFDFVISSLHQGCVAIASTLPLGASTPVANQLVESLRTQDWSSITDLSVDPMQYSSAEHYARDYLAAGLLRKYQHLPIQADCRGAAFAKWHEAEDACRRLNRLGGVDSDIANSGTLTGDLTLEAVIWTAREEIRRCLGTLNLDEIHSGFGFSGGASTRLPRRNGHPFYKYSGKPDVTRRAALMAVCAIWTIPLWRKAMQEAYGDDPCKWVNIVEGSKVTTVKKTAKIDRVIAIEPDMNMFMQRGLGSVIRRRLMKVGINLNDQGRNQFLAMLGSIANELATIDLQSASDSICLELVRLLLPPEWFDLIELLRCEVCILEGGLKHRLAKVSSMGNGFTFELESLIFWALAKATVKLRGDLDKRIGIYGDDIVVCTAAASDLIQVLKYCGFATNVEKTFTDGPFRESCGKHYFNGTDVTPFYVKEQRDDTANLYWLTNSFREWVSRHGDERSQDCYNHLVELCRRRSRGKLCLVPATLGLDAGLIVNLDEARPAWDRDAWQWKTMRLISRRKPHDPSGNSALLAWLAASRHETRMVVEHGEPVFYRESYRTSAWCLTNSFVSLLSS